MINPKKLYKNLVDAVALALQEIVEHNKYADKVLEKVLKSNPKWGARDRAFIAETVYDIVRHQRLLKKLTEDVTGYSGINEWIGLYLLQQGYEIPNWLLFEHFQNIDYQLVNAKIENISSPAVLQSYPDWLYSRLENELGKSAWDKEAVCLNQPADVFLRVNTLKVNPNKLIALLAEEGIETEVVKPFAYTLRLLKRQNVFRSAYFKQGYFEVQDWSSQQVVPLLNPEPGMRIVDACAGAGGKTLHMAALMKNKGKIIAMDTEGWKLKILMERANRAGVTIIEPRVIDSAKAIKRLHDSADGLLTDVPCSGLGVIRRNPDTKWKLTNEAIERTRLVQQEILQNYTSIVRKNGAFVYATCSILPTENEFQVNTFLNENKAYRLVNTNTIYPSESGADGFFMALMKHQG
ncbi:MAG TPA: class I SAM-dependent methyltransferase [Cytophagaceae bacterium]|nr:class I SAM-dependent methyltransferase [Cytophagaceae bacterium]